MIDSTMIMKDAGLVAASAAGTVATAAKIVNVGSGLVEGLLVVDVSAIEIASNTELYSIALQGSDVADFSTGDEVIVELAVLNLGATEVIGGTADSTVGRYEIPFRNEYMGTIYPYVRVYTTVAGDVATGINFKAHIQA